MGTAAGSAVVQIRIERLEPLTGTAAMRDGAELAFEGWMELIGAVAELLCSPAQPPSLEQALPTGSREKGVEP